MALTICGACGECTGVGYDVCRVCGASQALANEAGGEDWGRSCGGFLAVFWGTVVVLTVVLFAWLGGK